MKPFCISFIWFIISAMSPMLSAEPDPRIQQALLREDALLYRKLPIPEPFLITRNRHTFGGDDREELVLWDPTARHIYIYTPKPFDESIYRGYVSGPRPYNPRLMD